MEEFLLFAGPTYYPGYGWHDFVGAFGTLEEAAEHGRHMAAEADANYHKPGTGQGIDWWHVVYKKQVVREGLEVGPRERTWKEYDSAWWERDRRDS